MEKRKGGARARQIFAIFLATGLPCCLAGSISGPGSTDGSAAAGPGGAQPGAGSSANVNSASTETCVPAPAADVMAGPAVAYVVTTADANLLLAPQPSSPSATGGCDAPGVVSLIVDANITYQTIEGFGAHFTDSSARAWKDPQLYDELFNPNTGLGINLLHVDVGAGEFSSNGPLTYDGKGNNLAPDPNLTNFSMSGAEDHYLFGVLHNIRQANPNVRLIASPWSGPSWMKDSNSYAGGSLAPRYLGTMAQYMLMFLQAYQAAGNTFYAIAPQNEPDTSMPGEANKLIYPSSLLPAAQETDFINSYLGPLLRAQEPNVKLFTYEGDWSGVDHPMTVLADPTARGYVSGVAFHCDTGDASAQDKVLESYPEQEVWVTRCGRTQATSFAEDLSWYGQNLVVGALTHGARSLIMYNVVLDQYNGKVGYGSGYANYGSNQRPLVNLYNNVPDIAGTVMARNVEYYVMGHLAKYIMRGAYRIGSSVGGSGILEVAFQNPNKSFAVFVLNTQNTSLPISVHFGAYAAQLVIPAQAISTLTWPSPD